jgi:hypothetical protein
VRHLDVRRPGQNVRLACRRLQDLLFIHPNLEDIRAGKEDYIVIQQTGSETEIVLVRENLRPRSVPKLQTSFIRKPPANWNISVADWIVTETCKLGALYYEGSDEIIIPEAWDQVIYGLIIEGDIDMEWLTRCLEERSEDWPMIPEVVLQCQKGSKGSLPLGLARHDNEINYAYGSVIPDLATILEDLKDVRLGHVAHLTLPCALNLASRLGGGDYRCSSSAGPIIDNEYREKARLVSFTMRICGRGSIGEASELRSHLPAISELTKALLRIGGVYCDYTIEFVHIEHWFKGANEDTVKALGETITGEIEAEIVRLLSNEDGAGWRQLEIHERRAI